MVANRRLHANTLRMARTIHVPRTGTALTLRKEAARQSSRAPVAQNRGQGLRSSALTGSEHSGCSDVPFWRCPTLQVHAAANDPRTHGPGADAALAEAVPLADLILHHRTLLLGVRWRGLECAQEAREVIAVSQREAAVDRSAADAPRPVHPVRWTHSADMAAQAVRVRQSD